MQVIVVDLQRFGYSARTMAHLDPEHERRRMAERYAAMSDEELRDAASAMPSLTDAARAALHAEVARRGLDVAFADFEPARPQGGPIVLRRYLWLHEALLAKSILDSAGVECILADEHTIRMDWFWSLALGEVKLWVREEDADASELLDQDWVESFVVSGVGEYAQPRCPRCESFEVSYRQLLKRLAYFSLSVFWLLSFVPPVTFHESAWRCRTCGYSWEEDGMPASRPLGSGE